MNCLVAWMSRKILKKRQGESAQNQSGDSVSDPDEHGESTPCENESDSRVALSVPILRAYFSHGRNCIYDCRGVLKEGEENSTKDQVGILCPFAWNILFSSFRRKNDAEMDDFGVRLLRIITLDNYPNRKRNPLIPEH